MTRGVACAWLSLVLAASAWGMGFTEDPGETQKRNFAVAPFDTLTVRGEVTLQIRQGDHYSVTVQTNRALFDQLSVFSLFGQASIAIETGLRGPRELGTVEVWVTLPSLSTLTLLDHSSAIVDWPSEQGKITVLDGSSADVSFTGTRLRLELGSESQAVLTGSSGILSLLGRNASAVDARNFQSGAVDLELDEGSRVRLGPTLSWTGTLRHGATAQASGPAPAGKLTTY